MKKRQAEKIMKRHYRFISRYKEGTILKAYTIFSKKFKCSENFIEENFVVVPNIPVIDVSIMKNFRRKKWIQKKNKI